MFGMGTQEILIVLAVALIFIGPKRLPEIARTLGKGFGELKRAADDLRHQVDYDTEAQDDEEDLPDVDIQRKDSDTPETTAPAPQESSNTEAQASSSAHDQKKETVPEKAAES